MDPIERFHIEQLLAISRGNLRKLEFQAAQHGGYGSAPVLLTNQIDAALAEIATLEERLSQIHPQHNLPPRDYERFVRWNGVVDGYDRTIFNQSPYRSVRDSSIFVCCLRVRRERHGIRKYARHGDGIAWLSLLYSRPKQ